MSLKVNAMKITTEISSSQSSFRFYTVELNSICGLSWSIQTILFRFFFLGIGLMGGEVKSVQSALSDLLTTSATHGTFSRPSTKRGLISIGLELNTNARESFEHC